MTHPIKAKADPQSRPDSAKKPYRRPAVISRENLEVIAAVCSPPGKANPGDCPTGPITS